MQILRSRNTIQLFYPLLVAIKGSFIPLLNVFILLQRSLSTTTTRVSTSHPLKTHPLPIQGIISITFFANIDWRSFSLNTSRRTTVTQNWGNRERLHLARLAQLEWISTIFFYFKSCFTTPLFWLPCFALYQTILAIRERIFILFVSAKFDIYRSCYWYHSCLPLTEEEESMPIKE